MVQIRLLVEPGYDRYVITADYNLLRPLRALLEERSVTRAAERLHVAQPTMSIMLSRLRAHYDDPLLVRAGNSYDLTALGQQLLSQLPTTLREVERVLQLQATFDPLQSTRTFEVLGIDYSVAKVAPALNRIVAAEAPDVRFVFGSALPEVIDGMPDSLRSFDGIILPHGYLADQSHVDLYTDEWVCIVDTNSDISGQATVDELVHRRWVHTLSHQEGMTLARRQMQAHGLGMTMGAVTPQFLVVPSLVTGTDRVAILPESLARSAERRGEGVRVVQLPHPIDPIREAFWWHKDREYDAGHIWFRDVLQRATIEGIA